MKFSVGIPTGEEGVYAPVPFAGPKEIVQLARLAERLEFDAVWGIDFTTPSPSMGIIDKEPPNWYEILITLAYLAAATRRIKLGTGVLVLPNREPVLLAKQVATLDAFSGGRFLLGVGVGRYRDEFRAIYPRLWDANRASMMEEELEALTRLLTQDEASFKGQHYEFQGVSLNPKPLQRPLPIYLAGNHPETIRRVARWCTGWMMSVSTSLESFRGRVEKLSKALEDNGRDLSEIDLTAVSVHSIARTHEQAVERFKNTRIVMRSKGQDLGDFVQRNLIGTPSEIAEKIAELKGEGATHIMMINHANNTFQELVEQVQMFGEEVLPLFRR